MYAITGAGGRLGRKLLKDGSSNLSRLIGRPTAPIQDAVSEALAVITPADQSWPGKRRMV